MSDAPNDNVRSLEEILLANKLTRRQVLRRVAFGAGTVLIPGLLAACVDDFNPLEPGEDPSTAGEVGALGGSEPFLSEIKVVSFNFPPKGWALCNGQFLPINQNQALFALLGTTYGGNGQTTFALPNLRGRVPIHMGNGHTLGEAAGSTSVTVNIQQLPNHLHLLQATKSAATSDDPTGMVFGQAGANLYSPFSSAVAMGPSSVSSVGGSQPHNNMMPYLTLNFIIALQGIFPARN
jgi:microcystin-dependent protein